MVDAKEEMESLELFNEGTMVFCWGHVEKPLELCSGGAYPLDPKFFGWATDKQVSKITKPESN